MESNTADEVDYGEAKCLVVFLRPTLTLAEMTSWPTNTLFAFGEVYSNFAGDWTGFYDWLRNRNHLVIGVRYWPFDSTEFVIDRSQSAAYTRCLDHRCLEVFFGDDREVSEQLSNDQDFLYDPVYVSPSGACALAFSTDGLSETDYKSIARAKAEWVPI